MRIDGRLVVGPGLEDVGGRVNRRLEVVVKWGMVIDDWRLE